MEGGHNVPQLRFEVVTSYAISRMLSMECTSPSHVHLYQIHIHASQCRSPFYLGIKFLPFNCTISYHDDLTIASVSD